MNGHNSLYAKITVSVSNRFLMPEFDLSSALKRYELSYKQKCKLCVGVYT
jgi:hypothetical protein